MAAMTSFEQHPPITAGTESHQITTDMQRCIDACANAHAVCVAAVEYCLTVGGKHAEPAHIRMLLDCADICETGQHFMLRNSPLHPRTCALTAEIAEECAQHCEDLPDAGPQLRMTADALRECVLLCRQMSQELH